MRFLTISVATLFSVFGIAQTIYVKDAVSLDLIPHVSIVENGTTNYALTSKSGEALLDSFSRNAIITISHIGYISIKLKKDQIIKNQTIWMEPDSEQLNEIVLSVSRSTIKKQRLAQQVGIISEIDIEKQHPENTSGLLRRIPGVRVQQSQGGGGSPVLRGFEANRVLLVVDGVRLNNAISRSGHMHNSLSVDPLSLTRAEVVFGPSSVGYGSDALGGVIHFYSRTPLINQINKYDASFSSSYDFSQKTSKNSITLEYSATKWAVLQYLSISNFGDIVMGNRRPHGYNDWGKVFEFSENTNKRYLKSPTTNTDPNIQRNSAYSQFDFLQKWVYHSEDRFKFSLNLQGSQSSNILRLDKLMEYRDGKLRFARWEYGPQKRLLVSPQIYLTGNSPWLKSGKIIIAAQVLEESRIMRKFGSLDRETQRENLKVFSLNADFKGKINDKIDFSYGLESTHNDVRSTAYSQTLYTKGREALGLLNRTPIATRYPSGGGTYSTFAAYIDYRYDINLKSTLSLGARQTITELNASWSEQALIDVRLDRVNQNNKASNFTLGYTQLVNSKTQLKALISTGFRSPNIDDLGKTREHGGVLTVPNMHLNPEYIRNSEIGLKYRWQKKSFLDLNAYYAIINNYIARSSHVVFGDKSTNDESTILYSGEELRTISNTNLGSVRMYGINVQNEWQVSHYFRHIGNFTLTKGEGNRLSGNLPSISPLFISQRFQCTNKKSQIELSWHHVNGKNPNNYSPWGEDGLEETPLNAQGEYVGTPAWHRWDIQFTFNLNTSTKLSGVLFNIFDTHYKEFASGVSAPGRSLKLILRYNL